MQTKQFTDSPNSIKAAVATSSVAKLIAAGSLAIGVVAMIPAAPAGAVVFTTGQVAANGFTRDFFQDVTAGSGFSVDFSGNATADTSGSPALSVIASYFNGSLGVTPVTGNFNYISGTGESLVYELASNLTFDFANNISYTVAAGSQFQSLYNNNNQGVSFGVIGNVGSFLTDRTNGDVTQALTSVFTFSDIPGIVGTNTAGTYSFVASPVAAAVPEPFTIIATLIGGTAAFRMKKKLANSAKK